MAPLPYLSMYINLTFSIQQHASVQIFKIVLFTNLSFPSFSFSSISLVFSPPFMASETENSHVGLVELEELEVMEIDEALLRELLEEQGEVEAEGECLVESVERGSKMMEEKEEVHKQEARYTEQYEGRKGENSMMEIVNPASQNDVIQNWYPDDTIGMMTDFGFANGELCSQICEGLMSNEPYHGCFWEDM